MRTAISRTTRSSATWMLLEEKVGSASHFRPIWRLIKNKNKPVVNSYWTLVGLFAGTLITGLSDRVKFLQTQLTNAPLNSTQRWWWPFKCHWLSHRLSLLSSPKTLPCIEDAWNFPISQEMASRQNAFQRQNQGLMANEDSFSTQASSVKRQKVEGPPKLSPAGEPHSPHYLNQQQMQIMNFLHQNQVWVNWQTIAISADTHALDVMQANLSPQQKSLIQQQCRLLSQQKQMPLLKSQPQQGQTPVPNTPFQSDSSANATNSVPRDESMSQQLRLSLNQSIPHLHSGSKTSPQSVQQKMAPNSGQSVTTDQNKANPSLSDHDLQSLLAQRQVTASLTEDLIVQLGLEPTSKQNCHSTHSSHNNITAIASSAQNNCEQTISSFLCSDNSKQSQTKSEDNLKSISISSTSSQPQLNIKMTANEIIDLCKKLPKNTRIVSSLVSNDGRPPCPPDPPYPPLPKDKLHPPAPSVFVSHIL